MYIDALCNGLDDLPKNSVIRNQLIEQYEIKGIISLQEKLKQNDPNFFKVIDIHNPHRLIRALEINAITGESNVKLREQKKDKKRLFNTIKIGLFTDRSVLYERINARVDEMINNGLLAEVEFLKEYKNINALNTVGYKELFDFLDNKTTFEEVVKLIKQNTRRFAKRQLTWFRKDSSIHWVDTNDTNLFETVLKVIQKVNFQRS